MKNKKGLSFLGICLGILILLVLVLGGYVVFNPTDKQSKLEKEVNYKMPSGIICEDKDMVLSFKNISHLFSNCEDNETYLDPKSWEKIYSVEYVVPKKWIEVFK